MTADAPAPPDRVVRVHSERAFEDAVVASLVGSGWVQSQSSYYNAEFALDTAMLFEFVGATQTADWDRLISYSGGDPDVARREFVRLLAKQIDNRGTLDVLRYGVTDRGVKIDLAYFCPAHTVAEGALDRYRGNRLSVVRQLHYSVADAHNSLDLVLFVNGIPVATAELKSSASAGHPQDVEDAKRQYRTNRNPTESLFARRTLAHFAIDEEAVFVTTRLAGEKTAFLPFNQGSAGPGNAGGAGNPPLEPANAANAANPANITVGVSP